MRRPQHNKIGNVHLKWAFSEGAVLFLRNNERGQRWHDKLVQRYGKAKAMSIIAQKLGRTVYYMLKRKEAFNPDKFYGIRKLKIRTVAASISHTSLCAVCMRRNYLTRRPRGLRITEAYTAELLKNEDYMRLWPPVILSVPDAVTS